MWNHFESHRVFSLWILAKQGEKGRRGRSKCQKGAAGTPGLRGESVRSRSSTHFSEATEER